MSSSEQKISSLRIASSPIARDAYKKAASAGFMMLIIAFAFMMAVSALLNGVTAGGITQAVAPAILLTLLLYTAVPSVALSIATILLMPSSLKGNYPKIAHSLSLLMKCLDRLDELERAEASLNAACAFLNQDKILTGYTKLDRDRICSFVHVIRAIFYLRKRRTAEADVEAIKYINFQKMHPGNRMAIEWLNMLGREYLLVSE